MLHPTLLPPPPLPILPPRKEARGQRSRGMISQGTREGSFISSAFFSRKMSCLQVRQGGPRVDWAAMALAGLCLLAVLPTAEGTCATFAAWLRPENVMPSGAMCGGSPCGHSVTAFATLTVAPDSQSVVVTMQVTATGVAVDRQFTGAGIFGPALAGQVKPMGSGALLTLGTPVMAAGKTHSSTVRIASPDGMGNILSYLRAGAMYVSISTQENPDGELRGQLEAPECYEAAMSGPSWSSGPVNPPVTPYGFANVLLSPSESSYAVLIQMASDDERAFPGEPTAAQLSTVAGASILPTPISTSGSTNFYQVPTPCYDQMDPVGSWILEPTLKNFQAPILNCGMQTLDFKRREG